MAARKNLNWLAYRRRRWLVAFFAALLVLVVWQLIAPSQVDVVIYNDTVRTVASVQLAVGATKIDYGAIESRHSVVRSLPAEARGELVIWLPDAATERTAGPWVDWDETVQVVVHVRERGLVTFSVLPSWRARVTRWLR